MDTTPEARIADLWTCCEDYRRQFQSEQEIEDVLRALELETAASLLDLGCGNGAFAIAAAERHPECGVYAIDALESAVRECRRQAPGAGLRRLPAVVGRVEAVPFADESFDRILCRGVLHHLADAHAALAAPVRTARRAYVT
jgi:ubiquinone/menaquinone biosynthesis C-methylase UbiE